MKRPVILVCLGIGLFASNGCGQDPNQPQTLQQQTAMARGHAPTKEELAKAMARFKAPAGPAQAPPGRAGGPGSAHP